MDILHIVDEPYDSGIVHYALSAGCALKGRGHAVHVAGRAHKFPIQRAAELGLKTLALPPFPASVVTLRRYISEQNINLINVHTGSSHTLAVLATRGLDNDIPVIRTRGDSRPAKRTATGSLLWSRTSGFIAATNRILGEFRAANPHLKMKMSAILPGIPDPGEEASAAVSNGAPMKVGIVARLDPVKGHVHFLRAAQRVLREMPQVRFAIAGPEENIKTSHLKSLASELEISEQVEFLGHVSDVSSFMRRCHVGAVASIESEAISRVAIEWISVGRPLVATSVGSLPEIVSEGETGYLVPPEDADLMSKYLLTLLKNPDLLRDFGLQARKRFKSHFTEARFADETEQFYENTILSLSPR